MTAEVLLARLRKVRKTGPDRWLACCPAHDDKHPSLSIRELPDGRTLVKCWTGCDTEDVLAAAGLEFDALFPPRPLSAHSYKPERHGWNARDALRALAFEITTVRMIALMMQREGRISDASNARLGAAMVRLHAADGMINED